MIAHGVSRGLSVKGNQPRRGARFRAVWLSVAPLGLGIHNPRPPTADAVGYCLSALRAWGGGRMIRGVGRGAGPHRRAWDGRARGAEHRQMIAHGASRGLSVKGNQPRRGARFRAVWLSIAPLGLGIHNPCPPTADAVGYCLSALRAWGAKPPASPTNGPQFPSTVTSEVSPGAISSTRTRRRWSPLTSSVSCPGALFSRACPSGVR